MVPVVFDEEADAEPLRAVGDLSGVPVLDVDGEDAGELFGALAEAESGLVRYLDLAVARSARHVLVPIGHARLEEGATGTRARLRAVTREELLEIPAFDPDFAALDDEYHRAVLAAFGRFLYGERYYAHPAFDHSGLYAGDHPIVRDEGVSEPVGAEPALQPLSALKGYRVAPGEPDIQGLPVVTRGGHRAGRIGDLLVDPRALQVRYVVLEREGADRLVVLPVGFLMVDTREVRAPALAAEDLDRLPAYIPGPVDRSQEEKLRGVLEGILSGSRRYDRPDFRRLPVLR